MDARSPETLAVAGVFFAAVAISAAGYKTVRPPAPAAAEASPAVCEALDARRISQVTGLPVSAARALPGLGGADCYYGLGSPYADLLVSWRPASWTQENAALPRPASVSVNGLGRPAVWIPSEQALQAQGANGQTLYVGFWSDHGAPSPANAQALAVKVARAALSDGAAQPPTAPA